MLPTPGMVQDNHRVSSSPEATPRSWQRTVIMREVFIILHLYLNISGLNLPSTDTYQEPPMSPFTEPLLLSFMHRAGTSNKPPSTLQFTTALVQNPETRKMLYDSPSSHDGSRCGALLRHWHHSNSRERIRKAEGPTTSAGS